MSEQLTAARLTGNVITPQDFADQLDEQERDEEQRAHQERLDFIAWRRNQKRRELERQ